MTAKQPHTGNPLRSLGRDAATMPMSCDVPSLFSRQTCQVLCSPPRQWRLHSPSCLQVSWRETEALPTGERMHSDKKQPFPPAIYPFLLSLVTAGTKIQRSVFFQFGPSQLQWMEEQKGTHCPGHDVKERINRELPFNYDLLPHL